MNTFAERLRFARRLRQLTQADLARTCRISQGAIANYESSSRQFPRAIFQLAAALNVSAQWLAEGVGPMDFDAPALAGTRYQLADGNPEHPILDWPFKNISPDIYWALGQADRDLIENTVAGLVSSLFNKNQ